MIWSNAHKYSISALCKCLGIARSTYFVNYCELKHAVTVVAAIISMAKNLGIKTVAESVEIKEQIVFLKELGCDIGQGYYYAKPMPALELDKMLTVEKQLDCDGYLTTNG